MNLRGFRMDNTSKTTIILNNASAELRVISGSEAEIRIRNDLDSNHQGSPSMTVTIRYADGAEFSMFSTSALPNLQAYLRGFTHALQLVSGNYAFKPVSEAARTKPRVSILPLKNAPTVEDRGLIICGNPKRGIWPDSAKMPRFAFQRVKFRKED